MLSDQAYVILSAVVIAILSLGLTFTLIRSYFRKRSTAKLFWSLGMVSFAISTILQIFFAFGIYSTNLISLYLFMVVLLVLLFSLGSLQSFKNKSIHLFYYGYATFVALLVIYSIVTSGIGNLLIGYVVAGLPPDFVIW